MLGPVRWLGALDQIQMLPSVRSGGLDPCTSTRSGPADYAFAHQKHQLPPFFEKKKEKEKHQLPPDRVLDMDHCTLYWDNMLPRQQPIYLKSFQYRKLFLQ